MTSIRTTVEGRKEIAKIEVGQFVGLLISSVKTEYSRLNVSVLGDIVAPTEGLLPTDISFELPEGFINGPEDWASSVKGRKNVQTFFDFVADLAGRCSTLAMSKAGGRYFVRSEICVKRLYSNQIEILRGDWFANSSSAELGRKSLDQLIRAVVSGMVITKLVFQLVWTADGSSPGPRSSVSEKKAYLHGLYGKFGSSDDLTPTAPPARAPLKPRNFTAGDRAEPMRVSDLMRRLSQVDPNCTVKFLTETDDYSVLGTDADDEHVYLIGRAEPKS